VSKLIKIRRGDGNIRLVTPEELARIERNKTTGEKLELVSETRRLFMFRLVMLVVIIGGLLAPELRRIF